MTRRSRSSYILGTTAVLIASALLAAGCSDGDDSDEAQGTNVAEAGSNGSTAPENSSEEFDIGVLIFDTTVPYLAAEASAIEERAGECGLNADVQNGELDLAKQIAAVQQFVTQKKDAIIVNASDPDALIPAIKQANEAGIPVFATASVINEGADVIATSAADNREFGRLQGEMVLDAVGDTARVAYITGVPGSEPVVHRRDGFMEVVSEHPGIEIVDEQPADWDFSKALTVTQNFLAQYPNGELDAVVDQGPEGVTGAEFAHENGRNDVKFILGDLPKQVKQSIEDGAVYGTVLQDPRVQGIDAVENACNYLRGETSEVNEGFDPTPLEIITEKNVADASAY